MSIGRSNPHPHLMIVLLLFCKIASGQASLPTYPATAPTNYKGATSTNTYTPLPIIDSTGQRTPQLPIGVAPISDRVRRSFRINPFYTRALIVDGIPIIGSDKVSDFAFLECAYTLDHMLKDSPVFVKQDLTTARVLMGIIAVVEYTMDMPENQTRRNLEPKEAAFQDRRSRGLGGMPIATCAEENLLNLPGDPYIRENITIHEFSHTIASAIRIADPAWYQQLRDTYKQAMQAGLFANTYSATNEQEYWAEGAQAWFDCAQRKKDPTVHSGIWHRDQLKSYDPRLAKLLTEIFGDGDWRYVKTTNEPVRVEDKILIRTAAELTHLTGLDRSAFPAFNFENSPRVQAVHAIGN